MNQETFTALMQIAFVLLCVIMLIPVYHVKTLDTAHTGKQGQWQAHLFFHVQVLIPVSGTRSSGFLRSNSSFRLGKWELDSVILEFKGRPQSLTIVDTTRPHTADDGIY